MNITISDKAQALLVLDQELDALERDFVMLELKKQLNRQRAKEVRTAMKQIISLAQYTVSGDLE